MADQKPVLAVVDYHPFMGPPQLLLDAANGDFDILFIQSMRFPWDPATVTELEKLELPVLMLDDAIANPALVEHCSGILSIGDTTIRETARLAQSAGIANYHTPEVADRISSKAAQRHAFARNGVLQPAWCEVDLSNPNWMETVPANLSGKSLVAKPVRGWVSTGVTFIPSIERAPEMLAGAEGAWLIEAQIVSSPHPLGNWLADHVSVQTISFEGTHYLLGVMDRPPQAPPFRSSGDIVPSLLPDPLREQCEAMAIAAVDALGIKNGWSHTEFILAEDGPNVLEVNGRATGTAHDASLHLYGASPLRNWFDVALGRRPDVKSFEVGGRTVCNYYVQAPERPVDREAVIRLIPELEAMPEVFRVAPFSLDNLDGTAATVASNAIMSVWLDIPSADRVRETLDRFHALLTPIGLCAWLNAPTKDAALEGVVS